MSQILLNRWTTDAQYTQLLNYLINKTKDAKSPINIQQLIRDFKEKSGTALTDGCIKSRIDRMRAIIHSFEHIETDTKVRMLFALSVPVNKDFLQKLSNHALVEVDEDNRITHYKSQRLELEGYHRQLTAYDTKPYWIYDREGIDLLNYLIEETENVKSPMNLLQLARDFKEKSGALQTAESLAQRITRVRFMIHSFEHIDTNTKVKLLFALSVPVNAHFLEELRERAIVEVDEMNRITYYEAINDGMELSGDQSLAGRLETAHHELKRSRWSTSYFGNKDDVVPKTGDEEELQVDYDTNYLIDDQVKLEPFRGEIQEDLKRIIDDKDIQQIPKPIETPIKVEVEEPIEVKPETLHNSKIKFFEAMQSLILFLDTPSLSWIQSKIYQKIQKIKGLDEVILNNEIVQILDLLIARVTNDSVVNLSENAESVNLSNFLCYLKASILNSKMSGVEGLVQNISKLIEESQNKRIPMEKVANALRATLNND